MSPSLKLLSLCAVLLAGGAVCVADKAKPEPLAPLTCTLRGPESIEAGTVPKLTVELRNWTEDEILLVGALDGSDCGMRYPLCQFDLIGPDGKSPVGPLGRCGNTNPLEEASFVKIAAGGVFNPFRASRDGSAYAIQLRGDTFKAEGSYRIRFVYSTMAADDRRWLGDGQPSPKLMELLGRVPRAVVPSNEITLKVVGKK